MLRILVAMAVALLLLNVPKTADSRIDVKAVAIDELAYIEAQGFALPAHALAVLDTWLQAAWTIYSPVPVSYVIALQPYYDEAQARKHAAHEVAHMLMLATRTHPPGEAGEEAADRFALCYGSQLAREYAGKWGRVRSVTEEECTALAAKLRAQ